LIEALLILVGVLLTATVGAAIEYYKQLRKVQKEHEKAKEVVDDIVLSFNRQVKREAEKLEFVAYKVEAVSSKIDKAVSGTDEAAKKVQSLEPKVEAALEDGKKRSSQLDEMGKLIRDAVASQAALAAKVSALEGQVQQFSVIPEAKIEAVIPIKREKALAPLTQTELSVLEMLALEGTKTAPGIKDGIKLSREHTARLMKKLYERGYLERDSTKIPFRYSVKKEMERLLKKPSSEVT
jgi:chromosome segregation ATPase